MTARSITAPELASALQALRVSGAVASVAGITGRDGLAVICVSDTDGGHCYVNEVIGGRGGHFYEMGYSTSPHLVSFVRTFVANCTPGAAIL